MADPRFRNGVFQNTAALKRNLTFQKALEMERANPQAHGWNIYEWCEKIQQTIYEKRHYLLFYVPEHEAWQIEPPQGDVVICRGYSLEEITKLVDEDWIPKAETWENDTETD
jgi:hypothetical protein